MNDLILIESQSARTEKMNGVSDSHAIEHLNKAKALTMAMWQGVGVATTAQMAEYYESPLDTVQSFIKNNRDELESDGLRVVRGDDLKVLKNIVMSSNDITDLDSINRLTIWTPRAALRLGMLLRDSPIAKAVRTVLLNIVESATQPRPAHDLAIRKLDLKIEIARLELEKLELQREYYAPLPHSPAIPIQQELNLDIEQRFKQSQKDLLKAKALENEYKAQQLEQKYAPKINSKLSGIENTESVEAYMRERAKFNPNAKTHIGNANSDSTKLLYPNYLQYCSQHNLAFVAMQSFSKVLMHFAYTSLEVRLSKGRDRDGCFLRGVSF